MKSIRVGIEIFMTMYNLNIKTTPKVIVNGKKTYFLVEWLFDCFK